MHSPGFSKLSSLKNKKEPLWADAATCKYIRGHDVEANDMQFCCFLVEFWCERTNDPGPTMSVEIHAPKHWSPTYFLEMLGKKLKHLPVISLINSYYIDGVPLPFNTINTIHYEYKAAT